MSVLVKKVSKAFAETPALSSLSLEAKKGSVTGLLGPNGAGKSTLMSIMATYHSPDSGQVFVNGVDTQVHPTAVRRMVGYLPESNPLYRDMYVREFLAFMGRLHGLGGRRLRARTGEVTARFGLRLKQDQKIHALSMGYRQRVGLARVFLHDPQVLVLDEPTAGLDPNQLTEVRGLIREAARERTVLFSTHILQEAQALCDRVIVMHKGEKVMDEAMETLSSRGGASDGGARALEAVFQSLTTEDTAVGRP